MFSLDINVLRHDVMVAHDTLTVVVEVRILLSQQILTLELTKITLVMKNRDIEERAKKAYLIDETNMIVGLIQRNSYILGATEQKAIDIKKICNWLPNCFIFKQGTLSIVDCDALIRELCKTMEK